MLTKGTKEWAATNVNFCKGCSNGCLYCYARRMGERFGYKKYDDWPNMELKTEMAKKGFKKRKGMVMSPSSHDITKDNVDLAIKVFSNILKPGNKLLIVSKPDIDVIKKLCLALKEWKEQILFRFTIGTLNDKVLEYWEPFAPRVENRLSVLKYAHKNGWETSVSVEPFLDQTVVKLVKTLIPYVTHTIWVGPMNKIHVPKELWTSKLTKLYSKESLLTIKQAIDNFNCPKIRYKDHFITKLGLGLDKELILPEIAIQKVTELTNSK